MPHPSPQVNWSGFYVLDPLPSKSSSFTSTTSSFKTSNTTSSSSTSSPPSSSSTQKKLILGPFQGKVACQTIKFSQGVCGTAASQKRSIVVEDVDQFVGHVACDGETGSEIVVPIFLRRGDEEEEEEGQGKEKEEGKRKKKMVVVGVIDVDCREKGAFDEVDRLWLERLAELLGGGCDW